MQFASKSINGIIYHTSRQIEYYREYFPWIAEKARFIPLEQMWSFEEVKTEKRECGALYSVCGIYQERLGYSYKSVSKMEREA